MKRILAASLLVAALFVGILIFWFSQEEKQPQARTESTIRVVLWNYDIVAYDRRMIEEFENIHPEIHVDVISYNSLYYKDSLRTLLDSNQRVDVIYVNQLEQLSMLTDRNIPLQLDPLAKRDGVDLSRYRALDMLRNADTGELLGLPYRNDRFLLYYNKDMFDAAGLSYPSASMTWEEYYNLGQTLSTRLDATEKAVFLFNTSGRLMAQTCSRPFDIWQDPFINLKPGLTMLRNLQEHGISTDLTQMDNREVMQREFDRGGYAMFINGDWQVNQLHEDTKNGLVSFRWGVTELPYWSTDHPNQIPIWQTPLCINRNTTEKEAAWEFVKFVCGADGAKMLAEDLIVPGYVSPEVESVFEKAARQYGIDAQLCLNSFDMPLTPPTSKEQLLTEKIYAEYERILLGLDTIDLGLAKMEQIRDTFMED